MAVLLITYDLNKGAGTFDYDNFYKIRDSYDHAKLSEFSYALKTDEAADAVKAKLKAVMDPNDYLYVVTLKHPYSGYGPKAANEWLAKNLPR
jgi:hypothetical protein